jgi:hypothetical protein
MRGSNTINDYGMLLNFSKGIFDIKGSQKSRIIIQEKDPYLTIDSISGTTLMEIGDSNYYLQTNDFTNSTASSSGKGFKLDLQKNRLTAYDFDLEAKSANGKSYVKLGIEQWDDDQYPYLIVHSEMDEDHPYGIDLLNISKYSFFIQSKNYVDSKAGLKIDLNAGSIVGHNFFLSATNELNYHMYLTSDSSLSPIYIQGKKTTLADGTTNSGIFMVNWDGSMSCGSSFSIDTAGKLWVSKANVGGWEVGPTYIKAGNTTLKDNGNIISVKEDSHSFSLLDGKMTGATITDSTLNNLTVNGTLTVADQGTFAISGNATFDGDVTINGTLSLPEDGKITIAG